jgi:hypothetical protein
VQDLQDTILNLIITGSRRGLSANCHLIFFLRPDPAQAHRGGGSPGGHGRRRSGQRWAAMGRARAQNRESRSRRTRWGAHLGRRTTAAAGERKSTPAGPFFFLWSTRASAGRRSGWAGSARRRNRGRGPKARAQGLACRARSPIGGGRRGQCPGHGRWPDGPRRAGELGRCGRSGLGRASGSAQSGLVNFLFVFEIFFSAKTNPGNAQKMFRGTKNTQKNHKNSRKIPRDRLRHE